MTKYFVVGKGSYPLGTSTKFIKGEIAFYERKNETPELLFCEVGGSRQKLEKKEFLKLVKYYE